MVTVCDFAAESILREHKSRAEPGQLSLHSFIQVRHRCNYGYQYGKNEWEKKECFYQVLTNSSAWNIWFYLKAWNHLSAITSVKLVDS